MQVVWTSKTYTKIIWNRQYSIKHRKRAILCDFSLDVIYYLYFNLSKLFKINYSLSFAGSNDVVQPKLLGQPFTRMWPLKFPKKKLYHPTYNRLGSKHFSLNRWTTIQSALELNKLKYKNKKTCGIQYIRSVSQTISFYKICFQCLFYIRFV